MTPEILFQQKLQTSVGKKISIRLNNNRSTMLSVRWDRFQTRVSMHRFFMQAPSHVLDDLVSYLRRETKSLKAPVKAFIEENILKLNYSNSINNQKFDTQGRCYELKEIFNSLNATYFNHSIDCHLTWFGRQNTRGGSRVTFGMYSHPERLIKIHRRLDQPFFPENVVSFVVFHEMLHHKFRPEINPVTGRRRVHTKEFLAFEKTFHAYREVTEWIKEKSKHFFFKVD